MKKVLSVGQCRPDSSSIARMLNSNFQVQIDEADVADNALAKARVNGYDLILVNRKLDADYSDGRAIIQLLKSDPATSKIPVMLVTNYSEHQDEAEKAGALRGFGKDDLKNPATVERLRAVLG